MIVFSYKLTFVQPLLQDIFIVTIKKKIFKTVTFIHHHTCLTSSWYIHLTLFVATACNGVLMHFKHVLTHSL